MLTTSKSLSFASRCKQLLGSLPEVGGNTGPPLLLMPCKAAPLYRILCVQNQQKLMYRSKVWHTKHAIKARAKQRGRVNFDGSEVEVQK